jgi:hypothetical protein
LYSSTDAELAWAAATTAKRPGSMLALLVLLKGFQRLGYLPRLADVPSTIVARSGRAPGSARTSIPR